LAAASIAQERATWRNSEQVLSKSAFKFSFQMH
jgi:hypothetical protein